MRLNTLILMICLTSIGCAGGYYNTPAYYGPTAPAYAPPHSPYHRYYNANPYRPLVRPTGGCMVSGTYTPNCPYNVVYEDMHVPYPYNRGVAPRPHVRDHRQMVVPARPGYRTAPPPPPGARIYR
jgi:hypothetical protein